MAVPKKRKSRAKTRQRRSVHDKMTPPTLSMCSDCGEPKLPHRVCLECGKYNGRQLLLGKV